MRSLVLDTSVAIAWYLPDAFAPAARSWQKQLLEGRARLVVPSLHFWEMANVLRTYVKRRELTPSLAEEIYTLHLDAPLAVEEPDRTAVLATALELDATACDAVFIALARTLDVPLLTAERKSRPWVARLGKLVETLPPPGSIS
ncbi:MAG: type II toxin-antitoxin system VapC family toxin [Thermoanaerobaculia bacterium]|jgi:predicted nucleic acid-binding protein|nr:type II toxin-antitoxin system VapC family toxin [Thermoanaerobaculia bacterium]